MKTDPPKKPSAEEMQDMADEHTVFGLAVLMMDLRTAVLLKNTPGIANAYMKSDVLLRSNPGFPERLKLAQAEIIAQMRLQGKPSQVILSADTKLEFDKLSANRPPDETL